MSVCQYHNSVSIITMTSPYNASILDSTKVSCRITREEDRWIIVTWEA